MPRTPSGLAQYAKRMGWTIPQVLWRFRRDALPRHVGQVGVGAPWSIDQWARRNGLSQQAASRLFREGKLRGVVRGGNPHARDPWWSTPRAAAARFQELQRNARQLAALRGDLDGLVREVRRNRKHIDAIVRLRSRVGHFAWRLDRLGRAHKRLLQHHWHVNAELKRSQLLLDEREVERIRKHLGINPAAAMAKRRWAKQKAVASTAPLEHHTNGLVEGGTAS